MSCRTTPAGSAWTTFARLESGLTDVQTLSAFHALRRTGRGMSGPDKDEWADFVLHERAEMQEAGFSEARTRSLLSRLDTAATQLPDGATWYALRNIRTQAQVNAVNVAEALAEHAATLGEPVADVRARYERYLNEVPRGRTTDVVPEGYTEVRQSLAQSGLPVDHGSYTAMQRIAAEAAAVRVTADPVRRIERIEFDASEGVHSAGYDPEGGRLEVVFRRRRAGQEDSTSRVYAYRGVPAETWAQMRAQSPGVVYNAQVRNHPEYRYESVEAEEADATRRCGGCGQWRGPSHTCPTRVAADAPAAQPTGLSPNAVGYGDYAPEVAADAHAADVASPPASPAEGPAETDSGTAAETTEVEASAPDPEPEPVPAASDRPEAVGAFHAGVSSRWNRVRGRGDSWDSPTYYDYATLHNVTQLRAAAVNQPVVLPVRYQGRGSIPNADGHVLTRHYNVRGEVVFDRPGRGQYVLSERELRCDCPDYAVNYRCQHIDGVMTVLRARYIPATRSGAAARSPEAVAAEVAQAQQAAEEALRVDWMRQEEWAAEARARWASTAPEDNYSTNFEAFAADHDAALARKAAGQPPIPYMTENVTNGMMTRESGRGFGVEMEFDFPSTMSGHQRSAALRAIGEDLHREGLTSTPSQMGYGSSRRRGYTDQHAGGWSYEQDCTVSGEIVSPVMYDEPETWQNLQRVCAILERHGAVASARTGSHVHVSMPNTTPATANELARSVNEHEDVMYRISQSPDRPSHRPMRWCGPNRAVPQGGYESVMTARSYSSSHHVGLNFQSVTGSGSDHVEVRHWDGTLNAATIQTQVKISGALVAAAERNGSAAAPSTRPREHVGAHATRLTAVRGRSRRALTPEELREDTATVRSFVDTLFTRREDKAQVASLFAVTKWQRAPRG